MDWHQFMSNTYSNLYPFNQYPSKLLLGRCAQFIEQSSQSFCFVDFSSLQFRAQSKHDLPKPNSEQALLHSPNLAPLSGIDALPRPTPLPTAHAELQRSAQRFLEFRPTPLPELLFQILTPFVAPRRVELPWSEFIIDAKSQKICVNPQFPRWLSV